MFEKADRVVGAVGYASVRQSGVDDDLVMTYEVGASDVIPRA